MANEKANLIQAIKELRNTADSFAWIMEARPFELETLIPDYHARLKEKMRLLSRARTNYNRSINKTSKS